MVSRVRSAVAQAKPGVLAPDASAPILLQKRTVPIKVAHVYEPPKSGSPQPDVLFFATPSVDAEEIDVWMHLLESFNLSYALWDVTAEGGISRAPQTGQDSRWVGHHDDALLVCPAASDATSAMLETRHVIKHLAASSSARTVAAVDPSKDEEATAEAAIDEGGMDEPKKVDAGGDYEEDPLGAGDDEEIEEIIVSTTPYAHEYDVGCACCGPWYVAKTNVAASEAADAGLLRNRAETAAGGTGKRPFTAADVTAPAASGASVLLFGADSQSLTARCFAASQLTYTLGPEVRHRPPSRTPRRGRACSARPSPHAAGSSDVSLASVPLPGGGAQAFSKNLLQQALNTDMAQLGTIGSPFSELDVYRKAEYLLACHVKRNPSCAPPPLKPETA